MPDFDCLRCGTAMHFVGQHKLQLGKTSWIFGDLPNLMVGALDVSIMACPPAASWNSLPAAFPSPAATTPACTSVSARNAALPTISTIPNVPCAAMSTPPGTSCKII